MEQRSGPYGAFTAARSMARGICQQQCAGTREAMRLPSARAARAKLLAQLYRAPDFAKRLV
jgi:hypothetical protein